MVLRDAKMITLTIPEGEKDEHHQLVFWGRRFGFGI